MFTLKDIAPLVMVDGAKAVIIREHKDANIDAETKKIVATQVKKAVKLPVIWMPYEVDVEVSYDNK